MSERFDGQLIVSDTAELAPPRRANSPREAFVAILNNAAKSQSQPRGPLRDRGFECRSNPLAAGGQVGSNDVLSGLRKMLELAQSGELEWRAAGEAGFAVVVTQDSVRLTLVVEISDLSPGISPRELQIAQLVARGATNQAIANALDISTWTVSTHLRRIFAKLGVGTRAQMVAQLFGTPQLFSGDGGTNGRRRTDVKSPAGSARPGPRQ